LDRQRHRDSDQQSADNGAAEAAEPADGLAIAPRAVKKM
jgi:hypothetical protein